jgi:hypothetical protein
MAETLLECLPVSTESEDFKRLADALDSGDLSVLPILADYLEEQGRDVRHLRDHLNIPIGKARDGVTDSTGSTMFYWHRHWSNTIMGEGKLKTKEIFSTLVAEIRYALVPDVAYYSSLSLAYMSLVHAAERQSE